jgi:hypothetical protein
MEVKQVPAQKQSKALHHRVYGLFAEQSMTAVD